MEWLAAEYGVSFEAAVWEVPLALALVLLPIRNERKHGVTHATHPERASMRARNKARAWLERNYSIMPGTSVEDIPWKL